jgi:hypothetical protein
MMNRYIEAACHFFETVTPVFTTSLDAHRFFVEQPHRLLARLRHLELSLTHSGDHLYLAGVQHPRPLVPGVPRTPRCGCGLALCRRKLYGAHNWAELIGGIRAVAPNLRQLDVNVRSEVDVETILSWFDAVEGERAVFRHWLNAFFVDVGGDDQDFPDASAPGYGDIDHVWYDPWEVPRRLVVQFSAGSERVVYEQRGCAMVRLELPVVSP